jgi:hypothetical protein
MLDLFRKNKNIFIISFFLLLSVSAAIGFFYQASWQKRQPDDRLIGQTASSSLNNAAAIGANLKNDAEIYAEAVKSNDSLLCRKLSLEMSRDLCLKEIGASSRNKDICALITDAKIKIECEDFYWINQSATVKDIALCSRISNTMFKKTCLLRVVATGAEQIDCGAAGDEDAQRICRAEKYYILGVEQKNLQDCNKIPDYIKKANCLSLVLDISLFSDNDHDGLNLKDEIMNNTDYAKADTDNDGFDDAKEIRGGFNPLGPGTLAEAQKKIKKK